MSFDIRMHLKRVPVCHAMWRLLPDREEAYFIGFRETL
jgi:hypothetical protein